MLSNALVFAGRAALQRQRLRWPRLRAVRGHAQLQRLLKQPTPGPALWLANWLLRLWLRMLLSALSTLPPQKRLRAARAPTTRASRPMGRAWRKTRGRQYSYPRAAASRGGILVGAALQRLDLHEHHALLRQRLHTHLALAASWREVPAMRLGWRAGPSRGPSHRSGGEIAGTTKGRLEVRSAWRTLSGRGGAGFKLPRLTSGLSPQCAASLIDWGSSWGGGKTCARWRA